MLIDMLIEIVQIDGYGWVYDQTVRNECTYWGWREIFNPATSEYASAGRAMLIELRVERS